MTTQEIHGLAIRYFIDQGLMLTKQMLLNIIQNAEQDNFSQNTYSWFTQQIFSKVKVYTQYSNYIKFEQFMFE